MLFPSSINLPEKLMILFYFIAEYYFIVYLYHIYSHCYSKESDSIYFYFIDIFI